MGFKDMMKSFLYENVEDDDQDLEEEEEEVELSAPSGEKHSFFGKKAQNAPAATPAAPAQPVQTAPAPAADSAPVTAGNMQQPVPNPYAANPVPAADYTNPALYTEPKINAGVPAADSGNFLSRIDDVIEEPAPAKKNEPSRVRKAMQAQREKNRFARQDYSSVISPIFGNVSEEERDVSMLHDAINLPKPVDTLEMIEIISPMYGSKPAAAPAKKKVQAVTASKAAAIPSKPKKAAPAQENHQKAAELIHAVNQEPDPDLPAVVGNEEPAVTGPADLGSFLSRKPAGKKNGSSSEGRH